MAPRLRTLALRLPLPLPLRQARGFGFTSSSGPSTAPTMDYMPMPYIEETSVREPPLARACGAAR